MHMSNEFRQIRRFLQKKEEKKGDKIKEKKDDQFEIKDRIYDKERVFFFSNGNV